MSLKDLWSDWPNREIEGLMKGYILAQLAFWLQQILVIHIEERRKDHFQMLTHHIITIVLMFSSYRFRHTRVANLILILMDIGDLTLAVSYPPLLTLPFLSCVHVRARVGRVFANRPSRSQNVSSTWATPSSATTLLAFSC